MIKLFEDKKIWKVSGTVRSYSDELSWHHISTKPDAEVQEKQQQKQLT